MGSRAIDVLGAHALRAIRFFPPGPLNAITDVAGVEVGHVTLKSSQSGLMTGVTAIWPSRDVWEQRPYASGAIVHGAGECTGFHQLLEWGTLETPIVFTSSLAVGRMHDAVVQELVGRHPTIAGQDEVILPVIAECDDSFLSRARELPLGVEHGRQALQTARSGAVLEGAVGAGTGMIAFDFKAGIGTSSRRVTIGKAEGRREFMLGILLNSNVGVRRQLRIGGHPVGACLQDELLPEPHSERSIVACLATDAPLRPDQLRRLCARVGFGFVRSGSYGSHGSGEIVVGFSTTAGERRMRKLGGSDQPLCTEEFVTDGALNPLYEAAVEATEEAMVNALVAAAVEQPIFEGRDGHRVHAMPVQRVREMLSTA